jgi:hypothetical protein
MDVRESQVQRELTVRAARQRATLEQQPPPRITQILGEAALSRVIGSPQVMAAQVGHLRELNRLGQVEIRVLPWRAGSHPAIASGPFTIMDFADPTDPDVVYLESIIGSRYLEQEDHLRKCRRVWDILTGQSIPLEEHLAMSDTPWIKAQASGQGGECVELRRSGDTIQVRDASTDGPCAQLHPGSGLPGSTASRRASLTISG